MEALIHSQQIPAFVSVTRLTSHTELEENPHNPIFFILFFALQVFDFTAAGSENDKTSERKKMNRRGREGAWEEVK